MYYSVHGPGKYFPFPLRPLPGAYPAGATGIDRGAEVHDGNAMVGDKSYFMRDTDVERETGSAALGRLISSFYYRISGQRFAGRGVKKQTPTNDKMPACHAPDNDTSTAGLYTNSSTYFKK